MICRTVLVEVALDFGERQGKTRPGMIFVLVNSAPLMERALDIRALASNNMLPSKDCVWSGRRCASCGRAGAGFEVHEWATTCSTSLRPQPIYLVI